jgi:hypothetical protein
MVFLLALAPRTWRGVWIIPCAIVVLLVSLAAASSGANVYVPGDDAPDGGSGTGVPDSGTSAPQAPTVPDVPEDDPVPGTKDPVEDQDSLTSPLETLPPEKDDGFPLIIPGNPIYILIVIVILGVISTYAPGEIRRIRIETAHRESMAARLSLARGDFVAALAGFDRAIDQAHSAYTRRWNVDKPAEWKLMPDRFYISLWQGRAVSLFGVGRRKSAAATMRMVRELEATVLDGH